MTELVRIYSSGGGGTGAQGTQGTQGIQGTAPSGFSGTITINQPTPQPPINIDVTDGLITNVY